MVMVIVAVVSPQKKQPNKNRVVEVLKLLLLPGVHACISTQ